MLTEYQRIQALEELDEDDSEGEESGDVSSFSMAWNRSNVLSITHRRANNQFEKTRQLKDKWEFFHVNRV